LKYVKHNALQDVNVLPESTGKDQDFVTPAFIHAGFLAMPFSSIEWKARISKKPTLIDRNRIFHFLIRGFGVLLKQPASLL